MLSYRGIQIITKKFLCTTKKSVGAFRIQDIMINGYQKKKIEAKSNEYPTQYIPNIFRVLGEIKCFIRKENRN